MNISNQIDASLQKLRLWGEEVDTGHWQGVSTEGKPDLVTQELLDLRLDAQMPDTIERAQNLIQPNLPWAEDHFRERVSRVPSNPGEQYKNWPWWRGQEEPTAVGGLTGQFFKFDHTYQERFWPKFVGHTYDDGMGSFTNITRGIRYEYGDLDDVINLLRRQPYTRQATFPIFFSEDTGAVHGGRIPCTLHYHFLRRGDNLHLWYAIRSCDAVRHFRDDIYMAVRLCQWVLNELRSKELQASGDTSIWDGVRPGFLHFTAYSFHVHKGDLHLL